MSSADREALLENLEKVRENADTKADARYKLAISAYRAAMVSDDAAIDFYLKCVEKVNFEDQQRKAADFREWKKKDEDKLKSPGFKLALRYQLRWLVLTLKAASEKAKSTELATEAQEIVDSIFRDIEKLEGQGQTLGHPVTSTVFARAYEVGALDKDKESWPLAPVQLDAIYGQVIFPQVRTPARIEALRAAWVRRIQQEISKFEYLSANEGGPRRPGSGAGPTAPGSPEHEKFMADNVPQLQWEMEMDLFRNGDEAGAAVRMLAHIQKHLDHKSSREWGAQLKNLLAPKTPATSPAATAPAQEN